jgi:ankyrin repeat protein
MPTRAQLSEIEADKEWHTPLMRAALAGDTEAVKVLAAKGEDVNAQDHAGRTALMFAVINMHTDAVSALLDLGADVNVRARDGGTALMLAASCGDEGLTRLLLDKGADVSGRYVATGKTAADLAAEKGHAAIVKLLDRATARK